MLAAARIVLLAWLAAGCRALPSDEPPLTSSDRPPNIVLILCDDLGWADLGAYGARTPCTPNLDRLAREGLRFTDFYVAQPVCSASRAALLTGCYPNRIGIAGALGPNDAQGLAESETTLAEVCRSRGYATAIFGKWHLGRAAPCLPAQHGFDHFHGIPYSNDMWPLHPETPAAYPALPMLEGESVVDLVGDQGPFTREVTDRAIEFVRAETARDRPFFLYVPYAMPHVPLSVSPEFLGRSGTGLYGDVIAELDASVGRILGVLGELGIERETLVLFLSDNGPWLSYGDHAGSAGPLREGKGTVFEGGVRVPCLARWPGHVPAGALCHEPAMTIDILPTVARLVDAKEPELAIDGRDISPLLLGVPGARSPHEALCFWYGKNELQALRAGRWKLHFPHGYRSMEGRPAGHDGRPGQYDYSRRTGLELYDLESDIGETVDAAPAHPDVVSHLCSLADEMRARLGDSLKGVAGPERRPSGLIQAELPLPRAEPAEASSR